LEKLRVMRYERRLKKRKESSLLRCCWKEKKKDKWKDVYGKERERFYNRNRGGINARELEDGNKGRLEEEIIRRERDEQKQ